MIRDVFYVFDFRLVCNFLRCVFIFESNGKMVPFLEIALSIQVCRTTRIYTFRWIFGMISSMDY